VWNDASDLPVVVPPSGSKVVCNASGEVIWLSHRHDSRLSRMLIATVSAIRGREPTPNPTVRRVATPQLSPIAGSVLPLPPKATG